MSKEQDLENKDKGITYSRCYALLSELKIFGELLTINAPSVLDIEATKLTGKRVDAMNVVWDYINELKYNCA